MGRISLCAHTEIKTNACVYSLLQLHPVENRGTLWLFLISRKEVLLTGKALKLPVKICFCCIASYTQVNQKKLVRDFYFYLVHSSYVQNV